LLACRGERSIDRRVVAVAVHHDPHVPALRRGAPADIRHVIHDCGTGAIEATGGHALGDGHADSVGGALAERAGRALDAGQQTVLWMPRGPAAPLAEVPWHGAPQIGFHPWLSTR
jgi:hypothetical protein